MNDHERMRRLIEEAGGEVEYMDKDGEGWSEYRVFMPPPEDWNDDE